jgi:hypothetical protein
MLIKREQQLKQRHDKGKLANWSTPLYTALNYRFFRPLYHIGLKRRKKS